MRNVIVLTGSTLLYTLLIVGTGKLFGGKNLLISLFAIMVVIPVVIGYLTQKYLTGKSIWTPAATLVIPVIPNVTILIYDQIKAGWGPMDVPLSATLGFIILQTIFVVVGAYIYYRNNRPDVSKGDTDT
jgi:hypothetical protein